MRKKEREYRQALVHFNRVAGQLKRYHDIDPEQYLQDVRTGKGVERALNKLKFDVEQEEISKRVEEYERKLEERYQEMLKEEDIERREEERERAKETLNANYGLGWDDDDYEEFWDTFGDVDIIKAFGSKQIIAKGEYYMNHRDELRPTKVAKIAKKLSGKIVGKGYKKEEAIDLLDKELEKALNRKKKRNKNDKI